MPKCKFCGDKYDYKYNSLTEPTCGEEDCILQFREMQKSKPKIESKKKCKGSTENTKGFGCGQENKDRKFGLGISDCKCYVNWLLNSEQGKAHCKIVTISTSKKIHKAKKTENLIKDRNTRIELISRDKYRAEVLQPNINKIARLIDFGCKCIATNLLGKMAGGHRISVGANRSTALNLHNIHIQSFASNNWKGGDNIKYDIGIKNRYGTEYLEFLNSLHQTPKIDLIKSVMIEVNQVALRICRELSKNEIHRTPLQRIELRNKYNIELGIYSEIFMIFKRT